MKTHLFAAAVLATSLTGFVRAEDTPPPTPAEKVPTSKDSALRAQMLEDAKQQAAATKVAPKPKSAAKPSPATAATPPAPAAPTPSPVLTPAATTEKDKADAAKPITPATTTPTPPTDATVLPKVEVNRTKANELGRMMYEQEKEIAREKQLTKSTELDKALNNSKVNLPLFGGQTTASRESVAAERVSLMEAEKDLIEEIAHARTDDQKAKLKKELQEIKKIRRDLEQSIR